MTQIAGHICFAALFSVFAFAAQAQNLVRLHAAYQDAPFEWCADGTPVSILMTMDGPDVVFGQNRSRFITVRRGADFVRENITPRDEVKTDGPTGRFFGSFELCGSIWTSYSVRGNWVVRDESGAELASRKVDTDEIRISTGDELPVFRFGYLEFEEQRMTAVEPLEIERTLSMGDTP